MRNLNKLFETNEEGLKNMQDKFSVNYYLIIHLSSVNKRQNKRCRRLYSQTNLNSMSFVRQTRKMSRREKKTRPSISQYLIRFLYIYHHPFKLKSHQYIWCLRLKQTICNPELCAAECIHLRDMNL